MIKVEEAFLHDVKPYTRVALSFVKMPSTGPSCVKVFAQVAFIFGIFTYTTTHDCHRNLETVWQADVGSSPVVSSSLVADFNGDNLNDVLVTSFNGQVSVVDGRLGHNLPGWPVTLPGKLIFAAPLLVCEINLYLI